MHKMSRRIKTFCGLFLAILYLGGACGFRQPSSPLSGGSHIRIEPSRTGKASSPNRSAKGPATPQEIGVQFFPEAQLVQSTLMRHAQGLSGAVRLHTRASYKEVVQFYRRLYEPQGAKIVDLSSPEGHMMALNWQTPEGNFTVTIKQDLASRHTIIHLVRTQGHSIKSAPPHK